MDYTLLMVKPKPPTAMADIAYQAHDTQAAQPWHRRTQPVPSPHQRIVSHRRQLSDQLSGFEALLVAFDHPEPLLITFERRVDATPSLIVKIDIGQPHSDRIVETV